jgi:3-hydroxybutyryl-CoA dehydrogenase
MTRLVSLAVLMGLVALFGLLSFRVMASFLLPMLLAAMLVVIFSPLHRWVRERTRWPDWAAAAVTTVAVVERLDPARTIGIDMLFDDAATKRRVLATNPATRSDMRDAAHALFAKDGKAVSVVRDSGGFITQRVVANIVNIASDMCQQAVCSPKDLDVAVTLGLGYPVGPLALGDKLGPTNVLEVLFNLQTVYGDPRYRPSPWLRRRGAIGLSLLHTED